MWVRNICFIFVPTKTNNIMSNRIETISAPVYTEKGEYFFGNKIGKLKSALFAEVSLITKTVSVCGHTAIAFDESGHTMVFPEVIKSFLNNISSEESVKILNDLATKAKFFF